MSKYSIAVAVGLGCLTLACGAPDVSAPESSRFLEWRRLGTGTPPCGETLRAESIARAAHTLGNDCSEWENREHGSRFFQGWAGPLIFGDTVWLDDHIAKVSYQVSASAVASGAALIGEAIYYSDAGWTNSSFTSTTYVTTGNAAASVNARFKNNNPTGTAVNGTIYW